MQFRKKISIEQNSLLQPLKFADEVYVQSILHYFKPIIRDLVDIINGINVTRLIAIFFYKRGKHETVMEMHNTISQSLEIIKTI